MRILVIGSGGREHALVWKIRQSSQVTAVFAAPGNGGTAKECENIPIFEKDFPALIHFAKEKQIDLVIPGPEAPLAMGLVDAFQAAGIPAFGPDRYCAQLESSKAFAKNVMQQAGIPTAASTVFRNAADAAAFIKKHGTPLVIKADGLAAGKGVTVAKTEQEALDAVRQSMQEHAFGDAGMQILVEDYLVGEEVSLLAFCSGTDALPLPSAQDHKAAFDGDQGPNTGGMGAYSPAPVLPDTQLEAMCDLVIRPVLRVMQNEGHPFRGILYAGLMMTQDGPRVLEYNVRFGDPECQPLLMRLENDLPELMCACIDGKLAAMHLHIRQESALGVVLAANGYPGNYAKNLPISGIENADALPGVKVFHAGTRMEDGKLFSSGGRVLCVTALGKDLAFAQKNAYTALQKIHMPDSRFRTDIGSKGLRH